MRAVLPYEVGYGRRVAGYRVLDSVEYHVFDPYVGRKIAQFTCFAKSRTSLHFSRLLIDNSVGKLSGNTASGGNSIPNPCNCA